MKHFVKSNEEKWKRILRASGLKATPIRILLLERLAGEHKLLSVEEIHASLKKGFANLATVYRSIRSFEEAGLVCSTELGDGVIRYELRSGAPELEAHHHHHLVCRICRDVKLVENCTIKKAPAWLKDLGYTEIDHRLDFFGVCPSCQKAA